MPLEDEFCDIVKKARMGQGYSMPEVAQKAGLSNKELEALEKGVRVPSAIEVEAIGSVLQLKTQPLAEIAIEHWMPEPLPSWVDGLVVTVMGDIGGYVVKGYVLYDSHSQEAVLVDTAYNAGAMLAVLKERGLQLMGVCLTHGHADHAVGLDRILDKWPVPVYLGGEDFSLLPWKPPREALSVPSQAQTISVGRLTIECIATPGHTPGGFCYKVHHEGENLCFVGDTLFAGSIGRSNPFSLYLRHLHSVRRNVLQLHSRTVLLPGHGPATTVKEEVEHNPFG